MIDCFLNQYFTNKIQAIKIKFKSLHLNYLTFNCSSSRIVSIIKLFIQNKSLTITNVSHEFGNLLLKFNVDLTFLKVF